MSITMFLMVEVIHDRGLSLRSTFIRRFIIYEPAAVLLCHLFRFLFQCLKDSDS